MVSVVHNQRVVGSTSNLSLSKTVKASRCHIDAIQLRAKKNLITINANRPIKIEGLVFLVHHPEPNPSQIILLALLFKCIDMIFPSHKSSI